MPNFNKVILMGNLTRDPELRYLPKGTAVASFGMAVNRTWKDAETGAAREEVTFVDIEAMGKQGELIGQYFKKGRPIMIEGRLKLDTWEDKTTREKRSKLRVMLESFTFVDSGQNREGGQGGPREGSQEPSSGYQSPPRPSAPSARAPAPQPPPSQHEPESGSAEEDDVPF